MSGRPAGEGRTEREEEAWVAVVRSTLRATRAPESLRARIGAMLAVELHSPT